MPAQERCRAPHSAFLSSSTLHIPNHTWFCPPTQERSPPRPKNTRVPLDCPTPVPNHRPWDRPKCFHPNHHRHRHPHPHPHSLLVGGWQNEADSFETFHG